MLKSKPGSFQPPVMVSLMTGEELEPRHWPKDWLWVNPLPPSLVVFTLATSVFWITTQTLIQKFGMSTTQKLQSKFTTIFNNKVITGMLTFVAFFVLIIIIAPLAHGYIYVYHFYFGFVGDFLLTYCLISSEEAMKLVKRKYAWTNGIMVAERKINPEEVYVSEIPTSRVADRRGHLQELEVSVIPMVEDRRVPHHVLEIHAPRDNVVNDRYCWL